MQDTGKFRLNTKDQFYTKKSIAELCIQRIIEKIPHAADMQWIEPAAGSGAFLNLVPPTTEKLGIDIEPKSPGILKGDFLLWTPPKIPAKQRLLFGNPPFGRQGSIAKKFIQHSAEIGASVIAFILPRSFVKPSMSSAFPLHYHMVSSEELPDNSFVVNTTPYDVPCVFQIWEKREEFRQVKAKVEPNSFKYVKAGVPFHIAIRRVGVNAGRTFLFTAGPFSAQSHYFIELSLSAQAKQTEIITRLNAHEFPTNTTGPRSLSKSEINEVLNELV
jgi:hypothetical protein